MNYVTCPKCGRRLCKAESGTKVEIECPKCGGITSFTIKDDVLYISKRHLEDLKSLITQHA